MQTAEKNKFKRYRERLKAKGLRQIHLWVPDTNRPGFADELRRQVASLKGAPEEQDALDFIEETADWSE
ncbi:MAG: antitoxin MazE family protein [Pseudomonadota bacterium]